MSTSIAQNIDALCQEKGVDREIVIDAMKEAVRAAAKKQFKSGEDIQVDWNRDRKSFPQQKRVDEGADPHDAVSKRRERWLATSRSGDQLLLPLRENRTHARKRKQILLEVVMRGDQH